MLNPQGADGHSAALVTPSDPVLRAGLWQRLSYVWTSRHQKRKQKKTRADQSLLQMDQLQTDRQDVFLRARRHSRRVRRLRFWLPISSVLIVVGFLGLSYVSNLGPGLLVTAALLSQGGLTMDNPKLNGFVDGRAYLVEADQARQNLDNPTMISLDSIRARIEMDEGLTVSFTAGQGLFDTKEETLALDQEILIQSSEGHAGRLEAADIDLKAGNLATRGAITLSLPDGRLEAGSMSVTDDGQTILFDDGVRMSIMPVGEPLRPGLSGN